MNLDEIKNRIENAQTISLPIVFVSDIDFVAKQYIERMNINFIYTQSVDDVTERADLFSIDNDVVYVYCCDELDFVPNENVIIICKKIVKSIIEKVNYVVIPKLEDWMIEDYAYSRLDGIDKTDIKWLIDICKHDIYRLKQEIDKVCIFPLKDRGYLFSKFKQDGVFADMSDKTVFSLSNALQNKNIDEVYGVYKDLQYASQSMDIEPFGLYTIVYNMFVKLIKVWLSANPTEQTVGLSNKQIYAINKLPRVYNKQQLVRIFEILCDIDLKIKTGQFSVEILMDYIVITALVV